MTIEIHSFATPDECLIAAKKILDEHGHIWAGFVYRHDEALQTMALRGSLELDQQCEYDALIERARELSLETKGTPAERVAIKRRLRSAGIPVDNDAPLRDLKTLDAIRERMALAP